VLGKDARTARTEGTPMIDKIELMPFEKDWPTTLDSLDGKITLIIRKINEIVDHLNLVHGDGQFHMSMYIPEEKHDD
jgi:hypothetical protein